MKPRYSHQRDRAMTLFEALVIVAVLAFLFIVIAPEFVIGDLAKGKAKRIACVNNLKQIGLAYSVWSNDHNGHFPMEVSITNGGIEELLSGGMPSSQLALKNFLIMSNELGTPKILHCPADEKTTTAIDFTSAFGNKNISYFACPDADRAFPQMMLSGDDNLATNGVAVSSGLLNIPTNVSMAWTEERHRKAGNLGLADGSVLQVTINGLQEISGQTGRATNRLVVP